MAFFNLEPGLQLFNPKKETFIAPPTTTLSILESFVIAKQGPLTVSNIRNVEAKVSANFIDFSQQI